MALDVVASSSFDSENNAPIWRIGIDFRNHDKIDAFSLALLKSNKKLSLPNLLKVYSIYFSSFCST